MKYRKELIRFADAMEFKLQEHDHKAGFDKLAFRELFIGKKQWNVDGLYGEMVELQEAIAQYGWYRKTKEIQADVKNLHRIAQEALDVASWLMVIHNRADDIAMRLTIDSVEGESNECPECGGIAVERTSVHRCLECGHTWGIE